MPDQVASPDQEVSAATGKAATYRPGLMGEMFHGETFRDIRGAILAMENRANAVFVASGLDYGTTTGNLTDLLQQDAASLSNSQMGDVSDNFALRFTGQVYLEAGNHQFYHQTDDGFRLSIDGKVISERDNFGAGMAVDEGLTIAKPGWYDIRYDYFEAWNKASVGLWHSVDGGPVQVLSAGALRHGGEMSHQPAAGDEALAREREHHEQAEPQIDWQQPDDSLIPVPPDDANHAAGLRGAVHLFQGRVTSVDEALARSSGTPAAEFISSRVYYNPTEGNLATLLGADQASLHDSAARYRQNSFALTMEGQIYLEQGIHRFGSRSDDGFRLTIGGETVSEHTGAWSSAETVGTITVQGAGWYDIRVDYFENRDNAGLQLRHAVGNDPLRALETDRLRHRTDDSQEPEPPAENTPPVARDDSVQVSRDGSVILNPLENDTDADGDRLTIREIGNAANGTAVLNPDGTVTYSPDAGFSGRDSFRYGVSDGRGGQSSAEVVVNVAVPQNTAPVGGDDSGLSGTAGQMMMIPIANLLANDSDADGDALSLIEVSNAVNGTASIMGGHIHFVPQNAGAAGFEYVLSDGQGGTDRVSVSLTIEAASDGGDGGDHDGGDHGGGEDGGDGGHDGHGGHGGFVMIDPPETAAEIRAFLDMVRSMPESHSHAGDASMVEEHMASLQLVPRDEATHIAINHGDWNDPAIWHNGEVPGAGARALVPEGIMVNYSAVNDASLFTVRVDGMLNFATDEDSRMLVDTMVVSPSGHLVIGTEDNPVQPDVKVDIVFADNGNIDTGWDPLLLSRGLVTHGSLRIHGAEKSAFLKVETDAMAGDRTLVLEEVPTGWQVGDKLVLTGTHQQGWYWDHDARTMAQAESQDEEVTITAINGNVITLAQPLAHDHDTPRADLKAYVASMTRNITFSSEGGEDLPSHQRGHTMFMHGDDVDVRYAGFVDLGRTDKSFTAIPLESTGGAGTLQPDTNLQTRYPFHFHRTGVADLDNPGMAVGNVVDGSPGWGFVHHDSNANFTENVAFNVFGAAFVAEVGNETGIWYRNIAIKSEGIGAGDYSIKARPQDFNDDGRTGDGFFFAGRLVEAAENVAANTNNGFVWYHRYQRAPVDPETIHQPDLGLGRDQLRTEVPSIQGFRDNEAFGTHTGLMVIKAHPHQGHDARSVFDGFLNWETREGVNVSYTAHYTFLNFDLLAQRTGDGPSDEVLQGVQIGGVAYDMVFNGLSADGFRYGVNLIDTRSDDGVDIGLLGNTIIDARFTNIGGQDINEPRAGVLQVLNGGDLTPGRLEFDYRGIDTLRPNTDLSLSGIKTDSIGAVDRSFYAEPQGLRRWEVDSFLEEYGYYRLEDGTPVVLVPDFIADRATGELVKFSLMVRLDYPASSLAGLSYNGVLDPDGAGPTTRNDHGMTGIDMDLVMDLVANDSSPRGLDVFVDGLTNPTHGDVYMQEDGTVLYRPDLGFTGTDQFFYWANDGQGNYVRETATVTVSADMHHPMMHDMIG